MRCENILFDLTLCAGGRFSNVDNFCKIVSQEYNLRNYSDLVTLLSSNLINNSKPTSNSQALDYFLRKDLANFSKEQYAPFDGDEYEILYSHAKKIVTFFQSIGLNISEDDINISICKTFPRPFHNNEGHAIAPDSYDESRYGIKKGIYFLESNISNYRSCLLLAHELLHIICSKHHPELLARGLEEGLCELIGSYIANSQLFDKTIARNYIKYRRFKYNETNQKSKLYTDYLRTAYLLLKSVGLENVVNIINGGREVIKNTETELIQKGKIATPDYSVQSIPADLSQDLDELLLGTIENEVLSPLACYIIDAYNGETTISEFSKANNINYGECKTAFEEIQHRVFGCITDGDSIEFSDIPQLKKNNNILYECPPKLKSSAAKNPTKNSSNSK